MLQIPDIGEEIMAEIFVKYPWGNPLDPAQNEGSLVDCALLPIWKTNLSIN